MRKRGEVVQADRIGDENTPWVISEGIARNVGVVNGREKALGAAPDGFDWDDIDCADEHVGVHVVEVRSRTVVARERDEILYCRTH